jgi:creatinine amidohydrolase/Fe(II)-dependent formamide hydrolase-like protein
MATFLSRLLIVVLAAVPIAIRANAESLPRILELAELNTDQIRSLDRAKTVVLMPGGILEQHGPYLPSFSDGFMNEWMTDRLARAVVNRPGWTALVLPTIPLGTGGANEIGGHFSFPGTYAVRSATLRAVFADLASEFGDQGFRWIFVVHVHGAPMHNRALDEAGDYFRDTYGGHMVHLLGLMPVFLAGGEEAPPNATASDELDVHAGALETSDLLALRPDLVASGYSSARPLRGDDWKGLVRIASDLGWPGYFGAPGQGSADRGRAGLERWARAAVDHMLQILDGADERSIPRYGSIMAGSTVSQEIDRAAAAHEHAREARYSEWLSKRQTATEASRPTSR